jgi:futalosine hydrolase
LTSDARDTDTSDMGSDDRSNSASVSLGSPTLVLVPTAIELEHLRALGGFDSGSCIVRTCGFGPIAAAAVAAHALCELRPARVLLVGIAGTYDAARLAIGEAAEFDEVLIDGIGAGEGSRRLGARELGFPQWPATKSDDAIFDRISLSPRSRAGSRAESKLLVSVCAISDAPEMAARRRDLFANASAEDMEGFGVALACRIAHVPLCIVRGISNAAGDRDTARWSVRAALASARELALAILRDENNGEAR